MDLPNLDHLITKEYYFDLPLSAGLIKKKAKIEVSFTCHCYSRGLGNNETPSPADTVIKDGKNHRVLCMERYHYSLNLPSLIDDLMTQNKEVYWTKHLNFFSLYLGQIGPNGESTLLPYNVFMNARKTKVDGQKEYIRMTIESAYLRREGAQPKPTGKPIRILNLLGEKWEGIQKKKR